MTAIMLATSTPVLVLGLAAGLALGACRTPRAPADARAGGSPAQPSPDPARPAGESQTTPPSDGAASAPAGVDPATVAAEVADLRFHKSRRGNLLATAGKRSAPLPVTNVFEIGPVRWSDDRSEVVVQYDDYCEQRHRVTFSARSLVARLENAQALVAHRARSHAAAAKGFARVVALDPDFDLAYTNLAAALTLAGKVEEAMTALAPLLARNPVQVYVKVMRDAELTALREQPAIVAQRSQAPGSAVIHAQSFTLQGAPLAIDQARQHIAVVDTEASWGACHFESILQIFSATTGEVRAELPIVTWDDSDPDTCDGRALLPDARARVAERVEVANRVLRDLGFAPAAKLKQYSGAEQPDAERAAIKIALTAAKLSLVVSEGKARVLRQDRVLVERPVPLALAIEWAVHVPEVDAVIYAWQRPGAEGCEGSDPTGIVVLPLASAPSKP
jgi:hypothetical protein